MPDFYFKRTIGGLAAGNKEAEEALKRFPLGDWVKAKITKPRNLAHTAKFFVLLDKVQPNTEYDTVEQFRTVLTIRMGYVDWVACPGVDHPVPIPRSISFSKMDQLEFDKFYQDAVNVILKYFLPGTTEEELVLEVASF